MKSIKLLLFFTVIACTLTAQAPNKFRYQAVARDQSGNVIIGTISVRTSLIADSPAGPVTYGETHDVTTNPQGVFDLTILDGNSVSGNINNLDWKNHQYWLKVEMKPAGESDFIFMGTTELLSVPYAQYAASAGTDLSAGEGILISNDVIHNIGDLSNFNELQVLSLTGDQLYISDGNSVTLPTGTTYTEGNGIDIIGNTISASDPSTTNELQSLSLNNNQLSISLGNTVTLPLPPSYTEGTGIDIVGNTISANDPSITNELQTISLNGNQLTLSNNGGSVTLPSGGSSAWTINNSEIRSTPTSNSVVIGSDNDHSSKFYVAAEGNDHGGNFYTPGTGDALHSYNNSTGAGISASSLNGKGGVFTSINGTGGYFSSTNGDAICTSGAVGINRTSPGRMLDVQGGARFDNEDYDTGIAAITAYGHHGEEGIYALAYNQGNAGLFVANGGHALVAENIGAGGIGTGILFTNGQTDWETYLDNAKDFNFAYEGVAKAWIYDTDGSYHNSSDRSLKKNIESFSNVLPRLTKLQAYTYQMKDADDDSPLSVGFMAQEVEEQFPQLVTEKNGYKSLCYDHFAVMSVEAIKEQQLQIASQQAKIDTLENEVENLRLLVHQLIEKSSGQ